MEPAIALIEPMRAALTQLQSEVSNLQIQSAAETQVMPHILKEFLSSIPGAPDEEGSVDRKHHSVCAGRW